MSILEILAVAGLVILPFMLFLASGVAIGVSLGLSSALYLLIFTDFTPRLVAQAFCVYLDSFIFIAAPLYILGGMLADRCGLLSDLFEFMYQLTRPVAGGLGVSFVLTAMVFAAITGVGPAATAALTVVFLPVMRKHHYNDRLSAGMLVAGGGLAMLIPPSVPLIIYGVITQVSISKLFIAGVIPGVTLAALFSILVVFLGRRQGFKGESVDWKAVKTSFPKSVPGILLPVIVLGCIYTGVTTATEAAGILVLYTVIVGIARGRLSFVKQLPDVLGETTRLLAVIWLLMGGAGIFSMLLTTEQVPQGIVQLVVGSGIGPTAFLLMMTVIYIILGCFIDSLSMMVVTLPVAFPVVQALGISPIVFAMIVVLNLILGLITPPVGMSLYAVSILGNVPLTEVFKGSLPFTLVLLGVTLFIIFVPQYALILTG